LDAADVICLDATSYESRRHGHLLSEVRMGRRGGEMDSPLRRIAQRALLRLISEAEPRSVNRSRGLSWFVVPENWRMKVGIRGVLPRNGGLVSAGDDTAAWRPLQGAFG